MSTAPLTLPRQTPRGLFGRFSTPTHLRIGLVVIWLFVVVFFGMVLIAAGRSRSAVKTVGEDTVPSIIAAQKIKSALADMHSNAANLLLHEPGEGKQSASDFEKRRVEATEGILAAAGNITYGEEEKAPLRHLLNALGDYQAATAQALILHEHGNRDLSLQKHRQADRLMHEIILPAADALDRANRQALDRAYADIQTSSLVALVGVLLGGVLLLSVLVLTQWFLYRRMRRIINPPLVVATVLTLVFLIWSVVLLRAEAQSLKTAKEDAFHSIHDLWRARAIASDANGDESRWLLDPARAAEYEKAFLAKTAQIAALPAHLSESDLREAVARGEVPKGFEGYLAQELGNITFTGERKAAVEALRTFLRYMAIDRNIRALESKDKHAAAVALCLGEKPGESNWAFDRFDAALGATIDINQKEFDNAVARGFRDLAGLQLAAPVAAVAVALLALFGLLTRLREYATH